MARKLTVNQTLRRALQTRLEKAQEKQAVLTAEIEQIEAALQNLPEPAPAPEPAASTEAAPKRKRGRPAAV
jgi:hypothetical protein